MIVFDAGVLIAHLETHDVFRPAATAFMEEYEELEFAAGVTTIAEVLVHPCQAGSAESVVAALESLVLVPLELTQGDIMGVAGIRADTGLRMPDAIVLHLAERHAAQLVTTDRAVARAARARGVEAHLLDPNSV